MPDKMSRLPEDLNAQFRSGDKVIFRFRENGWGELESTWGITNGTRGTILGFDKFIIDRPGTKQWMERHVNPDWCFVQLEKGGETIKVPTAILELADQELSERRSSLPPQDFRTRFALTLLEEFRVNRNRYQ